MSFSAKKYMKKLEMQEKSNPGNKTSYDRPWRGRAAVFKDKSKYNRNDAKNVMRRQINGGYYD